MRYEEFKTRIHAKLRRAPAGLTWNQLKTSLRLPYDRPCPEWVKRLERDIPLTRTAGPGRARLWKIKAPR